MSQLRLLQPRAADDFDATVQRFFSPALFDLGVEPPAMRLELAEKPDAYVMKAELPGVRKDDIEVRVDGNRVQITAEVRDELQRRDGERVLRSERTYGSVSRTVDLAHDVDPSRVQARYADGVLTLDLPKQPGRNGRSIAIQ